jgi:hypothetical protein
VSFRTAAGIARGAPLCECADAVYPILFTAHYATDVGAVTVGTAQTYLPVFGLTRPAKVRVSWLWPLLDRPHRLISAGTADNVFIDDDLTGELAPGGRLDRVLQVLENVSARVPMTVVADPDLLDELQVMSSGRYLVRTPGTTRAVAGRGSADAARWLLRLRSLLQSHPDIEVDLTPPADPDVESLSQHTLPWTASLSPEVQLRVATALGAVTTHSDLAWPVDATAGRATLTSLARRGVRTVVLRDAALRGRNTGPDTALSRLHAGGFSGIAAVTDAGTEALVARAVQVGRQGTAAVPALVSTIAMHAVAAPNAPHFVVLTAPRSLDPDVAAATRTILNTADSFWSAPLPLGQATATVPPANRARLHPLHHSSGLPGTVVDTAELVGERLPDLHSLFEIERNGTVQSTTANALLGPLPMAVQRTESVSWRTTRDHGVSAAQRIRADVEHWIRGVRVVQPAIGTYTLTSSSAPLPITVANTLAEPVSVELDVHTVGGLPGLSTDLPRTVIVGARSTLQVKVTVHLERTGRFPVEVVLQTPTGLVLGEPQPPLTIHSTAIGTIGTVITVVAGVILALALVVQTVRRLRARRRTAREPVPAPTPVGIS